jgi:hypothetical protein
MLHIRYPYIIQMSLNNTLFVCISTAKPSFGYHDRTNWSKYNFQNFDRTKIKIWSASREEKMQNNFKHSMQWKWFISVFWCLERIQQCRRSSKFQSKQKKASDGPSACTSLRLFLTARVLKLFFVKILSFRIFRTWVLI